MSLLWKQDFIQAALYNNKRKGKIKMDEKTQGKINELQLLEQNLQNILLQKNTFQTQLMEIDNALKEIKNTKEKAYKIVGPIMIEEKKEKIKKDLDSKKEVINLRLKTIEKQETQLKGKYTELQSEIMKELKKNGTKT